MKITEAIRIAWDAIVKNKIRSFLTMLGIIIGVVAVIMMVAISAGTEATIQDQITGLGSNLIFITSSFNASRGGAQSRLQTGSGGSGLVFDDAAAIEQQVAGVKAVVVEQNATEDVKVGGIALQSVSILGTTPDFLAVRGLTVQSGNNFDQTMVDNKSKVAVLGSALAKELFPGEDPVGQILTAGNTQLQVIGVLKAKGTVSGQNYDTQLFTPVTVVFQKFIPFQFARFLGNGVREIYVEIDPNKKMSDVILQIELLLAKRHKVTLDSPDFSITTQQDIISARESTTSAFRNLLAWVAGVSLIVGGIGIMNIMLVSVTERTREIGIRQSVGATPNDIRIQFLTEALLLSIVGGLIGILFGIAGAWIFGTASSMRTVVLPSSILLAFGSAFLIGAFFGFYPANQAAQLDPIEALRYE